MHISVFCRGILALVLVLLAGSAFGEAGCTGDAQRVVLVTGATGRQGGAVARELLQRGWTVRGLTRHPQSPKARALKVLGARMLQGDYDDPASLRTAMHGACGVFAVTNYWEAGYEREVAQGRAIIDAARASGIRQLVFTSVASADEATGIPAFDSKYEIEQYLVKSGLPYTILRPVSFMDNWLGQREAFAAGRLVTPAAPEQHHQWIAVRDIGFFVGEAFDHPHEWLGRAVDIAGDEMTMGEFAKLLSRVLGRPVRYQRKSWAEYAAGNRPDMVTMARWFARKGYSADVAGLRKRYPGLTSAESFLRQVDWGLVHFHRQFIDARYGQVHVLSSTPAGKTITRTPVACFDPNPFAGRYFRLFMRELGRDRVMIAPDYPGLGESDPPPAPPGMAGYAGAMADVLDALGYGKNGAGPVDVCGYHTGALVAIELAVSRPDLVRRLVLAGVPFYTGAERQAEYDKNVVAEPLREEFESLRKLWQFTVTDREPGVTLERGYDNFVDALKPKYRHPWPYEAVFSYPTEQRVVLVRQPVLILNTHGGLAAPTRAVTPLFPDARLIEIPELHHGVFDIGAARLAAEARPFLDAPARPPGGHGESH